MPMHTHFLMSSILMATDWPRLETHGLLKATAVPGPTMTHSGFNGIIGMNELQEDEKKQMKKLKFFIKDQNPLLLPLFLLLPSY